MEEKALYGNGIVYLKFINESELKKLGDVKASSVHCFPIKDEDILLTVNHRGIDIIGGHIEKGELPEMALRRECMEEACILPIEYKLIGAIQVDNRDFPEALEKGYPLIGYQLFYAVTKFDTYKFEAHHECTDRVYINHKDLKNEHHSWLNVHDQLIDEVQKHMKKKTSYKFKKY